jgi:hypothetical protein
MAKRQKHVNAKLLLAAIKLVTLDRLQLLISVLRAVMFQDVSSEDT